MLRKIFASLLALLAFTAVAQAQTFSAPAGVGAPAPYRYISAHFRGGANFNQLEQLYIGVSTDGESFTDVEATITGMPGGYTVRDPSLVPYKIGPYFYATFTVGSFGTSTGFGVIRSIDLNTWEWVTLADMTGLSGVNRVWAPEKMIDTDGLHEVFTASVNAGSTFSTQETHPTSPDLSTWSAPVAITGFPTNAIDTVIRRLGPNNYVAFYKVNDANGYIQRATSTSLFGPFTTTSTLDSLGLGLNVEAPTDLVPPSGGYQLRFDRYPMGMSLAADSADFATFTNLRAVGTSFPMPRHSGFMLLDLSDTTSLAYAQQMAIRGARVGSGDDYQLDGVTGPTRPGWVGSANTPGTGAARFIRVVPDRDMTIRQLSFYQLSPSNGADTIEMAVYDNAGNRMATTGTQAGIVNTGSNSRKVLTLPTPARLRKGQGYYFALNYVLKASTVSANIVTASYQQGLHSLYPTVVAGAVDMFFVDTAGANLAPTYIFANVAETTIAFSIVGYE